MTGVALCDSEVLEPGIVKVMHEAGVNVDVLAEMLDARLNLVAFCSVPSKDLVWEDAAKQGRPVQWGGWAAATEAKHHLLRLGEYGPGHEGVEPRDRQGLLLGTTGGKHL